MSSNVYTYLRSFPWPKGFRYQIVERDSGLFFVVFIENYAEFNPTDQQVLKELIGKALFTVRSRGVPIYLEVEEYVPR